MLANAKNVTLMDYCILKVAFQAKQNLQDPELPAQKAREALKLLHLGQQTMRRLKRQGIHLPEIDLSV